MPERLDKPESWRQWKSDEEQFKGMKDVLDKVRKQESTITEFFCIDLKRDWWDKGPISQRFVKMDTTGDACRVVVAASADNGWKA